jgi:hypothetical protein
MANVLIAITAGCKMSAGSRVGTHNLAAATRSLSASAAEKPARPCANAALVARNKNSGGFTFAMAKDATALHSQWARWD